MLVKDGRLGAVELAVGVAIMDVSSTRDSWKGSDKVGVDEQTRLEMPLPN